MSAPNIGNGLALHAFAFVNGPAGTIIDSVNIASITKNSTGDYTLFYGTEISDVQMIPVLTPVFPGFGAVSIISARFDSPTPNTNQIRINSFISADGSTPVDTLFQMCILRTSVLGE